MIVKFQKKCLHRFRKPLLYPFELRERANRENTPAAANGKPAPFGHFLILILILILIFAPTSISLFCRPRFA